MESEGTGSRRGSCVPEHGVMSDADELGSSGSLQGQNSDKRAPGN
jgi:hypothetical protein